MLQPLTGGLPAFFGANSQRGVDGLQKGGGEVLAQLGTVGEGAVGVVLINTFNRLRWQFPGNDAVTGSAEGVEVRPRAAFAVRCNLLDGGVARRADHGGGAFRLQGACGTEVDEHGRTIVLQQDVAGFEVAVQQVLGM